MSPLYTVVPNLVMACMPLPSLGTLVSAGPQWVKVCISCQIMPTMFHVFDLAAHAHTRHGAQEEDEEDEECKRMRGSRGRCVCVCVWLTFLCV